MKEIDRLVFIRMCVIAQGESYELRKRTETIVHAEPLRGVLR